MVPPVTSMHDTAPREDFSVTLLRMECGNPLQGSRFLPSAYSPSGQ